MSTVHVSRCTVGLGTYGVFNSISCNDKLLPAEVTLSSLYYSETPCCSWLGGSQERCKLREERRGEERKPDGELHWKWKTIGGGKEFLFFFLLLLIFRCYLHVMLDENVLWWLNTRLCTNTFTEPGFWLKHHSWDSLPSQQRLCGRKTSGFNLREVTEVKERNLWGGKECQQKDFFTAWTETSKLGKVEVTWSRGSNWSERSSTRRHSTGGR